MAQTVLLTEIDRTDSFPKMFPITADKNNFYVSITTNNWTEQMFYELPNIQFGIYTKVNGEYVKYLSENITVKTKVPESSTSPANAICYKIINIPNEFYLYIKPIFDNNAIEAHNALIENGIEDGTIWTTPTDTFHIKIEYNLGDYVPVTNTIIAVPPISFKSDGTPLISWSMLGNGQQTGTSTPDAPIMPEFVGARTTQLIPEYSAQSTTLYGVNWNSGSDGRITGSGTTTGGMNFFVVYNYSIPLKAGTYTLSFVGRKNIALILRDVTTATTISSIWSTTQSATFTIDDDIPETDRINLYFNTSQTGVSVDVDGYPMLNSGSTALPYEPYGYKIPITCAGQTVPVYLGQTQTVRRIKKLVLTGDEQWQFFSDVLGAWQFYINDIQLGGVAQSSCMSNIAPYGVTATTRQIYDYGCYLVTAGSGVGFQMKGAKDTFTNIPQWKAYLAQQYANGTPVTVWYVLATPTTGIVNEPLAKIGDYADELSSTDAGVTIPTVKGQNTLTVDTTLQPSEISITGTITQI